MIKLAPWIESDYHMPATGKSSNKLTYYLTQQNFIKGFSQNFARQKPFDAINVQLSNKPFQIAVIDKFFTDETMIPKLITEMESMEWTRKQMDLYEFYQTTDIANINTHHLEQFYKFLNTNVRNWMEELTGMKFQKISASCSMYNCGDHLLTHDDLLSDRLIAFVFYLSPWMNLEKWDESMGGALELFETDRYGQPNFPAAKKIFPVNNRFVFFKVDKKSYHQVGEVLTKDYPRLTINGWFHGFEDNIDFDSDAVKVKYPDKTSFKSPIDGTLNISFFINKTYLKESIKFSIQKQIEENSEAALGEFLIGSFHEKVTAELQDSKLEWVTKGPSNQQNYEYLNVEALKRGSSIKSLCDLMESNVMFKLLHEYTELDLHGSGAKHPMCTIEIQRWKGGCYTLIGDPSTYNSDTLDLILYFGSNENVGAITYLTPEQDSSDGVDSVASEEREDESVLLTIYPQNNFLNIVYRSKGTAKFTKYSSKSSVMQTEFNYILICSYKE